MNRILYIQYTNPAGYPPLEHSSRMLADAGWGVLFLGTGADGADPLAFPPYPGIESRRMSFQAAGWRQKLHYLTFCIWAAWTALFWRPEWIYASDVLSCPVVLALTFFPGLRVLYHEHDAPEISNGGIFMNLVARARKSLARRADMCVFPNRERLESFQRQLGPCRAALCVWNCPSIDEVLKEPRDSARNPIWLLYHGSIVPDRLPLDVIDALSLVPDTVRLRIVGYETAGTRGYVAELIGRAKALGITDRVEFLGAVPQRSQLLELTRKSDIGFALMPMTSNDTNLRTMTGASNKPFDYMACGLALIVSDLPAWRQMFVAPGYAVCCDPNNAESIASAIRSLSDNPKRMRSMGESGRRKILSAWNYDEAFAPVLEKIVTRSNLTSNSKQPALAASPIEK